MTISTALARLYERRRQVEGQLAGINIAIDVLQTTTPNDTPKRKRQVRDSRSGRIKNAIVDMFHSVHPVDGQVHRRAIMAQMVKLGFYKGEDPTREMRDLAVHLSVDGRFEKADYGSGYWRLTEEANDAR